MMNNLKAKLKKEGGFTLVEMLIVVAIIAILIAISIPMVSKALEKARHAVDQANIRDAIALGNIELLTENLSDAKEYKYVVDSASHQGKLVAVTESDEAVKCSCKCASHSNDGLTVKVDPDTFAVVASWSTDDTPTDATKGMTIGNTAYAAAKPVTTGP